MNDSYQDLMQGRYNLLNQQEIETLEIQIREYLFSEEFKLTAEKIASDSRKLPDEIRRAKENLSWDTLFKPMTI